MFRLQIHTFTTQKTLFQKSIIRDTYDRPIGHINGKWTYEQKYANARNRHLLHDVIRSASLAPIRHWAGKLFAS